MLTRLAHEFQTPVIVGVRQRLFADRIHDPLVLLPAYTGEDDMFLLTEPLEKSLSVRQWRDGAHDRCPPLES